MQHGIAETSPVELMPAGNGICYACFVSIPTAHGSGADLNRDIRHCENCGRFLYIVG